MPKTMHNRKDTSQEQRPMFSRKRPNFDKKKQYKDKKTRPDHSNNKVPCMPKLIPNKNTPTDKKTDIPKPKKRSIHDKQSILYYRKALQAEKSVLSVLEHKYKIPLIAEPTEYYEPNNYSAHRHKDFLWNKMMEWEARQTCQRTTVVL